MSNTGLSHTCLSFLWALRIFADLYNSSISLVSNFPATEPFKHDECRSVTYQMDSFQVPRLVQKVAEFSPYSTSMKFGDIEWCLTMGKIILECMKYIRIQNSTSTVVSPKIMYSHLLLHIESSGTLKNNDLALFEVN